MVSRTSLNPQPPPSTPPALPHWTEAAITELAAKEEEAEAERASLAMNVKNTDDAEPLGTSLPDTKRKVVRRNQSLSVVKMTDDQANSMFRRASTDEGEGEPVIDVFVSHAKVHTTGKPLHRPVTCSLTPRRTSSANPTTPLDSGWNIRKTAQCGWRML